MTPETKELYNEVIAGVKATQEKTDHLEKKYDGLVKEQLESIKESVTELAEKAQKAESVEKNMADFEEKLKGVEASLLRKKGADSEDGENEAIAAYKSALRDYARKNENIDQDISDAYISELVSKFAKHEDESKRSNLEKTLSVDSNPNGGYLIVPERIQSFVVGRNFETSPVRDVANIISTLRDEVEIVIDDDEAKSGGWVSEQQARPATDTPDVGLLTIPTHEQYAEPKATAKFLDDVSIDIEAWLTRKTEDILNRTENTSFVNGDGAAKPKGFLGYEPWSGTTYERGKLQQVNSGADGAFTADGVKCLQNSLHEVYQPNAVFMIKRSAFKDITTLKDQEGRYLLDTNSLKQGDTKILLGKRVIFADDIPGVASDSLSMVYGDFGVGYTIVDRLGIRVLRDPYTDKRYIKFYTTKRVGGAVTNYQALKIQKLAV